MAYKHDYDKILTRLTIILCRLNNGEALLVKDLAEEFNVNVRTIQRDFNQRLAGSYPIYQDGKRWKMQEGYKIEKSSTLEESITLNILDKLAKDIGAGFYQQAKTMLDKIKNNDAYSIYTRINIEDISDKLQEIALLDNAIKDKKVVTAFYKKEEKTNSIKVAPLKIVNFEGFWYLVAFDENDSKLKKYYFKNLLSIKSLDENYQISKNIDELVNNSMTIWFQENVEPFEVKLHVPKEITKYIQRQPITMNQVVESIFEDGSIQIALKITHEMEVFPFVKRWLPHIKIIEPKWLSDKLKNELSDFINSN